jgi:hypothetical protein
MVVLMERLELSGYTDHNGVVHFQNRQRLQEWGRMNPNKQFTITIGKKGSKRSTQANRYYWGVVIAEVRLGFLNIGYEMTAEQTHEFCKERFNSITIENKEGVNINVPGSTTQMTKTQFSEYIEKIARFAAEFLGVTIPAANESLEMKFE